MLELILLLLLLLPLAGGLILLLLKPGAARPVALLLTLAELGLAMLSDSLQHANGTLTYTAAWLPSYGISFALSADGLSILLVLLTGILLPVIVLSAWDRKLENASVFYGLILFMQAGLMGVFLAADGFLFYLFWEAALIPVYFLIASGGGEKRIQVTFKFFLYTVFGSLFMLVSLAYLYFQTAGNHSAAIADLYTAGAALDATTQCWLFCGLFIAFAIKMPLFPFHTWQPDTYTESPAAGTMLLSGIMLKMGVYGVMRWLLPLLPAAAVGHQGNIVMVLSVIGVVYGSVIAIRQKDIKRLVAYSSFAHVGLMAAGLFSLTNSGWQGASIQMLSHGVTVVGLFAVIEFIERRTHTRDIEKLGGITQSSVSLTILFLLILLGSVALPLTSGFIGEFLLLRGVFEWSPWYGAIAGLTIILGAVYMLRLFQFVMFGQKSEQTVQFAPLTLAEKATLIPLAILVIWIGVYPAPILELTAPAVEQLLKTAVR